MSTRVCAATLEQCGQPTGSLGAQATFNLVRQLGGLAPWWLAGEVLAQAARRSPALEQWLPLPALPTSLGSCWIVLVPKRPLPCLRPALLLPLRWREGASHAPQLPAPLHELAGQVTEQLGPLRWGLGLNEDAGLGGVDLSGLGGDDMGVASGWAALTGGLELARQERLPRADVWATAAWHPEFGIGQVEGLETKLALAALWGTREVFVPAGARFRR